MATFHDIKIPSRVVLEGVGNEGVNGLIIQASSPSTSLPTMTLGRALLILSHSSPQDWVSGILEESPLRSAFAALDLHIKNTKDAAAIITVSLLDQTADPTGKTKQSNQNTALELLYWLTLRYPTAFISALSAILVEPDISESSPHASSTDKNVMLLSLCSSVQYIIKRIKRIGHVDIGETASEQTGNERVQVNGKEQAPVRVVFSHFGTLLSPLVQITKATKTPTRLSVAALTTFCDITNLFAEHSLNTLNPTKHQTNTEDNLGTTPLATHSKPTNRPLIVEIGDNETQGDTITLRSIPQEHGLTQHLNVILDALRVLVKWYASSKKLLAKSLQEIIVCYESETDTLIAQSWKLISSYICFAPAQRLTKNWLSEVTPNIKDGQNARKLEYYRFLCLGILCGTLAKEQLIDFMDKSKDIVFPFLLLTIKRFPASQPIVADLLHLGLLESGHDQLCAYIYELLPDVLIVEHELDQNMLELLAKVIHWKGGTCTLLARTIEGLNSALQSHRENATNIVVTLMIQNDENIRDTLQKILVANVNNRELYHKISSRGLYGYFDIDFAVPKFVSLMYAEKGAPEYSHIVTSICTAATDPTKAFLVLLATCRPTPTLSTPGDFGSNLTGGYNEDWVNMVMKLVTVIATKIDSSFWPTGLPALVNSYLENPQDTILVKFLAAIANYIGQYLHSVLPVLVDRMKTQPSLTEEMLSSTSPESNAVIKNLLFERLAPLLVLKVVPYTSFASWTTSAMETAITAIREILMHRITQTYEFEEVRRVSALVLSFLPPSTWVLPSALTIQDSLQKGDYYTAKICIFSWFNGLSIQGVLLQSYFHLIAPVVMSILVISHVSEELQKLRLGAIDCLAVTLKIAIEQNDNPHNNVQSLTIPSFSSPLNKFITACQQHAENHHYIPQFVIGVAMPPFPFITDLQLDESAQQQLRLGVANAIANCAKASDHNASEKVANVFLKPLLDSLVSGISSSKSQVYVQAILALVSKLQGKVSLFSPIFSEFFGVTLSNKAFMTVGLTIILAVAQHDKLIISKDSKTMKALQEICLDIDSEVGRLAKTVLNTVQN